MSRWMQLHHVLGMKFPYTDLFLERISLEWNFRGSTVSI